MRVILALVVLALCFWLGGCSRPNQAAYAKPAASHPSKAVRKPPKPIKTAVKPQPPRSPNALVQPPTTAEAKFKAAQEKAKLSGVHTLTQKDIEGLTSEQIKELRGY